MSKYKLTSVSHSLMYNSADLNDEERKAASTIALFGQKGALGLLKQKGVDISDPSKLMQTEQYFDAYNEALVDLGFVQVVGTSTIKTDRSTHSGNINIGAILEAAIQIYIGATAKSSFEAISQLVKDSNDTSVNNFMDFWWSHASSTTKDHGFSASPIYKTADDLVGFGDVFYSFTATFTDWRSLFVSYHAEHLNTYTTGMKFKFDMDIYNTHKAAIEHRLGTSIDKEINSIPLG